MWKGKAIIGGNVGGIRLQIEDGQSGYLVNSAQEAGERIAQLLSDPALRETMGRNAKEKVRRCFLMPRLLYDYMRVAHQAHCTA
jgi:trehalose synthase